MPVSRALLRRTLFRSLAGLSLLSALTACGLKGPLYMPPPPPPEASLTTPPETGPLPGENEAAGAQAPAAATPSPAAPTPASP